MSPSPRCSCRHVEQGLLDVAGMTRLEMTALRGGLMMVPASLNGSPPMPAIIDVSATHSLLNAHAARLAGIDDDGRGGRHGIYDGWGGGGPQDAGSGGDDRDGRWLMDAAPVEVCLGASPGQVSTLPTESSPAMNPAAEPLS